MVKIKPLLPNLRQKKRYLAIEVLSKQKIGSIEAIFRSINRSMLDFFGQSGTSSAEMMLLANKSSPERQRLLIKVAAASVDKLRASLTMITQINNIDCIVRCIGASGMLNKAYTKYIAGIAG